VTPTFSFLVGDCTDEDDGNNRGDNDEAVNRVAATCAPEEYPPNTIGTVPFDVVFSRCFVSLSVLVSFLFAAPAISCAVLLPKPNS